MAKIEGFRALRFTKSAGAIDALVCPPYDVISENQRYALLERAAHNIVRLELPRDGEDPYREAAKILINWQNDGILACDGQPGLYICEEEFANDGVIMRINGMIARVGLEEQSSGVILPHEETLSKAKTDRLNLMKATGCNFSQIYSLYMDDGSTRDSVTKILARQPDVAFEGGDGVTHRLWAVYDPAFIEDMKLQFATRRLYIADGHHRYETALNYRRETHAPGSDYVMMTLVDMDSPGLLVLPTHRVVRDLPDFDGKAVLGACREYFEILEINPEDADLRLRAVYEKGKKSFVYYYGGKAFLLTLNNIAVMDGILPGKSASSRGLDVAVLHSLILERILKIDRENMANQVNLKYTREIGEAILAVDKGANCAFLLNPTRVQEIRDVAVAGEKMPQKSTYFYPKLITGLVMNKLDT